LLLAETLPNVDEAIGIARAMAATNVPYLISFVISRDGRVLDGTPLLDAIRRVDEAVDRKPLGFMVNCAYPTFLCADQQPAELFERLIGYQANASSLDHCDLDGADELQAESVADWGAEMLRLNRQFGLKILGGCCGTNADYLRYLVND
jgi:S-methylmethionine-dependent homocysteine/selenocysteine methylase